MTTVVFATEASPLPTGGGGTLLSLLSVSFDRPLSGTRNVTIRGFSEGAAQLQADVSTGAAPATQAINVPAAGSVFDLTVSVPGSVADDFLTLTVKQVGIQNPLSERAIVPLYGEPMDLPSGVHLGVHTSYLAGVADRLVRSLTFVKIDASFGHLGFLRKVIQAKSDGTYKAIDQPALERAILPQMSSAQSAVNQGSMGIKAYYTQLRDAVRQELPNHLIDPPARIANVLPRRSLSGGGPATPGIASTPGAASPSAPTTARAGGVNAMFTLGNSVLIPGSGLITTVPSEELQDAIDEALREMAAYQRLGVLFHERTRFRPAGLLVGEPFYQLALTPGEEVQLRQTTETRKRISLTDIQDREEEQQSTLSSTLSTDMSSTIGAQTSFQNSTTLGGGIEGNIPDVPVGVSANTANNVSNADSTSQQSTVTDRIERTSQASAKLRAQHKIQLEITTEESNTLASTRTLRNTNSLRTQHHTFHKMYRREQATLERHDAQLAFLLTVADASRGPRTAFEVGLNRLDPNNEDLYNLVPPSTMRSEKEPPKINAPDVDGGPLHGWVVDRWVHFNGDLRQIAGAPSTHCLAGPPKFTMTECHVFFGEPLHSTDGSDPTDDVAQNELTNPISYVHVAGKFARAGGAVKWHKKPQTGADDARFDLQINLPVNYTGPTQLLGEIESAITFVRFKIETEWRPKDQTLLDFQHDMLAEKQRLTRAFAVEDVMNLRATAASDYAASVINRALSENLVLPRGFSAERLRNIFDFDYVSITSHPYWTGDHGRSEHERLMARLLQMPAPLAVEQILTDELLAAGATVHLPIRHGSEEEALTLLPEAAVSAQRIAAEFTTFREQKYGLIANNNRQFDLPLGPTPPSFTPAGQNAWQTSWEGPQRRFDILGQWSETVPTDGVHIETHLSESVAADERALAKLSRLDDLGTA